uniref:AXH domain-containing protein n=1 Tax=Cuerna arida TaxID=1464854 RepID=A0A1B6EKJ1_9HEMI
MISSGLVAEGSHSGLGAGTSAPMHFPPSHMSYEPFLKGGGGIPPVPEFLRPLPKPAPLVPRYNAPQPRPVSLVQHKEEPSEDTTFPSSIYNSRLFPPPPPPFSHYPGLQGPYGSLYPAHYTPYRDRPLPNPNPPLSPLEAYPGPQSPQYSPPAPVKPGQSLLKDKRFKVPSGKEGSLKHRILTRPDPKKKKPTVTIQTPTEVQTPVATNNNIPTPSFNKGSLIQLASGELRKVEDMRTEDFVSSAEKSPALRLDPSTVVRIDNSTAAKGFNLLTLSYGENRNQVEFESALGHPYFVYGQGWASCDPEKTLSLYGLRCHQLQVGDICISLSPRTTSSSPSQGKKRRWSAPDQLQHSAKKSKE